MDFIIFKPLVKYITKGGNTKELTDQIALLQSQLNNFQGIIKIVLILTL